MGKERHELNINKCITPTRRSKGIHLNTYENNHTNYMYKKQHQNTIPIKTLLCSHMYLFCFYKWLFTPNEDSNHSHFEYRIFEQDDLYLPMLYFPCIVFHLCFNQTMDLFTDPQNSYLRYDSLWKAMESEQRSYHLDDQQYLRSHSLEPPSINIKY